MRLILVRCRWIAPVILSCLSVPALTAEDDVPLGVFNTDPLSQRGISPRVLDIAVSPLHQGAGFVMNFEFEETVGDAAPWAERGRVNFDPFTDYGRELNFEQFLWQVGEEQQLGVTQVGDMLYLGPRETALVLARQNQQWAARLEEPGFPPALRRQLTEAVRWKFSSAAEPSVWLSQDVRRAGLAVVNPEKLPFDFWEPIDWPALPRYQAWLLLLAGFELGIERYDIDHGGFAHGDGPGFIKYDGIEFGGRF